MGTGKKPSRKKTDAPRVYARHLRVTCGSEERGYLAGAMHGVNGHRTHAHQPCLADYTDGALQCAYCAAGLQLQWRGYLPVWDRDWALRYVLVGQDVAESVDAIAHGTQVKIMRAKNPISPLIVRAEQCLTRPLPPHAPYTAPVDMELICLTLWKCDALDQWVLSDRAKRGATEGPTPRRSDGKEFTPMLRGAAKKFIPQNDPAPAEEAFDAVRDRLKNKAASLVPSKNGHKKADG